MDLALFDFDGTVTVSDTYAPFLRFAVSPLRAAIGGTLVSPAFVAYKLGLLSTSRTRVVISRGSFQGAAATAVRSLGRRYATEVLPTVIRPTALDRLRWHQQRGDRVAVVSASLDVYLAPWCQAHDVECVCTELEERDGWMTGRYRGGDCSGEEKARRIRAQFDLSTFARIYAYGDSAEDRAMLALAHEKYFRWKHMRERTAETASGAAGGVEAQ
jgi:phosphatidylglycerophosphatase C